MSFFWCLHKRYFLITWIQSKFLFMEHSINNIRMHIEQSANKQFLSAYCKCQALCVIAGYIVMSELDTLDLFPLEICGVEEQVSSSCGGGPHVRNMFYMMIVMLAQLLVQVHTYLEQKFRETVLPLPLCSVLIFFFLFS